MKQFILPLAFVAVLSSCTSRQQEAARNAAQETKEAAGNLVNNVASGGVAGIYQGITPCADCEGIETRLYIYDDSSFVENTVYLGKPDKSQLFSSSGKWEKKDALITLTFPNGPRKYKLGLNKLIMLDADGKEINGNFKLRYILSKVGDF